MTRVSSALTRTIAFVRLNLLSAMSTAPHFNVLVALATTPIARNSAKVGRALIIHVLHQILLEQPAHPETTHLARITNIVVLRMSV